MKDFKFIIIKIWSKYAPRRKLIINEGDTPPKRIKSRNLYLAQEDGEEWAIALKCPCGCGDRLELQLTPESRPHWKLLNNNEKHPTIHPSIWRQRGCKSHFWIKKGRILWCKP